MNESNNKKLFLALGFFVIIIFIVVYFLFLNEDNTVEFIEENEVLVSEPFVEDRVEVIAMENGYIENEYYKPDWYLRQRVVFDENSKKKRLYTYREYDENNIVQPYNSEDYLEREYVYDNSGEEIIEIISYDI